LLEGDASLGMSVSVTTRTPRPGEVEGRDYFFVDTAEFERRRAAGELLEWAQVFGNLYATPKGPVMMALEAGRDVLFDIDWQGAQQLVEHLRQDTVRVFILPPDGRALEERLKARNQDAPDVVQRRMQAAAAEVSHWAEYDYVIVNADVEESLAGIKAILAAERLKRERQLGLSDLVRDILSSL
ncbi:MAG: guanylate kinase, partial [Hyphomicrobiaceae bacterium]